MLSQHLPLRASPSWGHTIVHLHRDEDQNSEVPRAVCHVRQLRHGGGADERFVEFDNEHGARRQELELRPLQVRADGGVFLLRRRSGGGGGGGGGPRELAVDEEVQGGGGCEGGEFGSAGARLERWSGAAKEPSRDEGECEGGDDGEEEEVEFYELHHGYYGWSSTAQEYCVRMKKKKIVMKLLLLFFGVIRFDFPHPLSIYLEFILTTFGV